MGIIKILIIIFALALYIQILISAIKDIANLLKAKKKRNIKRIPPGYITFSEQFTSSDFFKGENVEKEFDAFIKSLGMTKKDIKKMK